MKRLISIILIILTICAIYFPSMAFSDVKDDIHKESINHLTTLEILKGYEDGTFKSENNITRAEFVTVINRVVGVSGFTSAKTDVSAFIDVPSSHWASGDIEYAVKNKIISGYGNGYFGPEDPVTYEQAIKMIFCAMGYKPVAEASGGYPIGYIQLAVQNGITKGIGIQYKDEATRGNIAVILYEAMQVETMEQKTFGAEESIEKSGTTLLKELLRLRNSDILEGIVIENQSTSLYGETSLTEGQVKIQSLSQTEEWILDVGSTNATELLGQRVEFHINKDDNLPRPQITSITPVKNNYFEIDAQDIINVEKVGDTFAIEYEEQEKTKKITLGDLPAVIYNGSAIEAPVKEDLFIKNGKIKLCSNNQNSKYNIVMLDEYYSYRVDKISEGTSVIFLKDAEYYGLKRINLEPDEVDFYYTIYDIDGNEMELEDINADDVITVLSDKKRKNIKIVVSDKKIQGKPEEINEEEVIIGGEAYKVAKDTEGNVMLHATLTMDGTYYLDRYNQIVSYEEGEAVLENIGYILQKALSNNYSEEFAMKVLLGGFSKQEYDEEARKYYYTTGNKEIKTYYTADRTRINDVVKSSAEINQELKTGDLINFKLNKDGFITHIDVLNPMVTKENASFNPEIGAFGGEFIIDDKTVLIHIPNSTTPEEEDYFVNVELDASKYDVKGFEVDHETKIAKAAIIVSEMKADVPGYITSATDIMLVTNLYEKLIDEDNIYCILEGMQDGEEISLQVKSEAEVYTLAKNLRKGDLIYFSTNSQNLVDNIELVDSLLPLPEYIHRDQRGENERIFGKLYTITRNELSKSSNAFQSDFEITLAKEESADLNPVMFSELSKRMPEIYLLNSATGKVSVITIDDLYSVEEVGYEKATQVFICKRKSEIKAIIAIK